MSKGKIIAVIGKIACGKTTYCEKLLRENAGTVLLSMDEVYWHLFRNNAGDMHDKIAPGVREYLLAKAKNIASAGCDVLLDWGFWQKEVRRETRAFFEREGLECEWRYLYVSKERQRQNIQKRNAAVLRGDSRAYFVDDGLFEKSERLFEEPDCTEYDERIPFE